MGLGGFRARILGEDCNSNGEDRRELRGKILVPKFDGRFKMCKNRKDLSHRWKKVQIYVQFLQYPVITLTSSAVVKEKKPGANDDDM